ncbi:TR-interacting protein 13 [Polychytrium aggregatum]|uniref:TR-interacting protein 13 n=1 Tax=Polychytrium aggregatum TaxID=110093 RepID=UPI0022FE94F5|nr:TR-interacting protein 13 [Polychytrium aggregatum]KAI9193176.1 TR-interacting protein 13 [Polychytrium aggregatum]
MANKPVLHVEVELHQESTCLYDATKAACEVFLRSNFPKLTQNMQIAPEELQHDPALAAHVSRIRICEIPRTDSQSVVELDRVALKIHVYQLNKEDGVDELDDEDNIVTSNHWILPAASLDGVWVTPSDSLVFDQQIHNQLLSYMETSMLFSDRGVDSNIVAWNKIILLHGPPGTGKTSLCKALAQKLAIRLSDRYTHGKLVEINSHSLFSKFFSESGKLVMKMFQQIGELTEDTDAFVCVLIDEVESLTASRKAAINGLEPSDAIRVVNALLTQIDRLRKKKNVLILTTSNLTEAVDSAFLDRADLTQFIGYPSALSCYAILHSCLDELMIKGIIQPRQPLIEHRSISLFFNKDGSDPSSRLYAIAQKCKDASGRSLRRLAFKAHAFFVQSETSTLDMFLLALDRALAMDQNSKLGVGTAASALEHS